MSFSKSCKCKFINFRGMVLFHFQIRNCAELLVVSIMIKAIMFVLLVARSRVEQRPLIDRILRTGNKLPQAE